MPQLKEKSTKLICNTVSALTVSKISLSAFTEKNLNEKKKTVKVKQTHQHQIAFFIHWVYKHAPKTGIFNLIFE